MPKYRVTAYYETWESFLVEADSEEDAENMVREPPVPIAESSFIQLEDSGDNGNTDFVVEEVEE